MSLLSGLSTDSNIADEKDSVGGGSRTRESGLYPLTINLAYITKSTNGAMALNLLLADDDGEVRQQLWVTNRNGQNFYTDKKGDKQYLPGFNMANSLALLTVGKEIAALDTEDKVINLYNFDTKGDVPTKVDMIVDLLGKEVLVGLIKQTVDKTQKNPNFDQSKPEHKDTNPSYVPTGETRDENEIDKFFRAEDRMTSSEIKARATEAVFADTWDKKWTGVTRNRAKGAPAGTGTAGAPQVGGAASTKPQQSLFAKPNPSA
jgi:hypothetical protein